MSTKECRSCHELINKDASWCPKCQQPQHGLWALFPPHVIGLTIVLFGLGLFFLKGGMEGEEYDYYSEYPEPIYNAVDILELYDVAIQVNESGCETCVTVLGKVKNLTSDAYGDIHFELNYFDKDGQLVDTVNDQDYDLIVGPNASVGFRVKKAAAASIDQYESVTVNITKARVDSLPF